MSTNIFLQLGSLAKSVRHMTARSFESESSQILRTIQSNKVPNSLSQRLDATLRDSHNMMVFGLGTLSFMSSIDRYARFTHSMYGIYSTMEDELDLASSSSAPALEKFWRRHGKTLRRSEKLRKDLAAIGKTADNADSFSHSPATLDYINAIHEAGTHDRKYGGGRLLGHVYTRYLADLMGGQSLATPSCLALGLKDGTPEQYYFEFGLNKNKNDSITRKEYIETFYSDLNASGEIISQKKGHTCEGALNSILEEIVDEARAAFRYNIKVYSEEPIGIDSMIGLKNIISGWILRR